MACRSPDFLCELGFIGKFIVVITCQNLKNNFTFQKFSIPFFYGDPSPFLPTLPILLTFFVSLHVAHFGKVRSPFTKVWDKENYGYIHIYIYTYPILITLFNMPKGLQHNCKVSG